MTCRDDDDQQGRWRDWEPSGAESLHSTQFYAYRYTQRKARLSRHMNRYGTLPHLYSGRSHEAIAPVVLTATFVPTGQVNNQRLSVVNVMLSPACAACDASVCSARIYGVPLRRWRAQWSPHLSTWTLVALSPI